MPFTPPATYGSQANTGYQTKFSIGSPLAAVLEIKTLKINGIDVPDVDVSHLLSPSNTEELIPGMIKPGTIDIGGNYIGDATQNGLLTFAQTQAQEGFALVGPVKRGALTATFSGIGHIKKFDIGPFENNKPIDFTASIQVDGALTVNVA